MPVSAASWIGSKLSNGRYHVTGKLGEGGMGSVYQADDQNLCRPVVIKVPHPALMAVAGFAARFTREVRSLVRLDHPRIVKVLDVGEHSGLPFAVMQFLPGGSLADQVPTSHGRATRMQPGKLLAWLPSIAEALDFLHQEGYVHRDVKPANILLDTHGHAYLGDFGIVKALSSSGPQRTASLTVTGMVLGTPQYMAPELILAGAYDGRADQFALAVSVYELLSGRFPFDGPNATAIYDAQQKTTPPALHTLVPSISKELSAAVQKALMKEPANRFGTCMAFANAMLASMAKATSPQPQVLPTLQKTVIETKPNKPRTTSSRTASRATLEVDQRIQMTSLLDDLNLLLDCFALVEKARNGNPPAFIHVAGLLLSLTLCLGSGIMATSFENKGAAACAAVGYICSILVFILLIPFARGIQQLQLIAARTSLEEKIDEVSRDYPDLIQRWGGKKALKKQAIVVEMIKNRSSLLSDRIP